MTKDEFYNQLHNEIAKELNTTPYAIQTIRTLFYNASKGKQEIARWALQKMSLPRRNKTQSRIDHRIKPKSYYQEIVKLCTSTDEIFDIITKPALEYGKDI